MSEPSPGISPALEATLLRYRTTVLDVGQRHGLIGADLDEVLQAVRIRLWRALKDDGKISAVTPFYIRQAARYAALDLIRGRRGGAADPDLGERPLPGGGLPPVESPAARLERKEIAEQVAQAINSLSPSRQPVVRMYLTGYNSEEIADVFGWTEAKARNLLYRGLTDLRERLTAMGLTPDTVP